MDTYADETESFFLFLELYMQQAKTIKSAADITNVSSMITAAIITINDVDISLLSTLLLFLAVVVVKVGVVLPHPSAGVGEPVESLQSIMSTISSNSVLKDGVN